MRFRRAGGRCWGSSIDDCRCDNHEHRYANAEQPTLFGGVDPHGPPPALTREGRLKGARVTGFEDSRGGI